ncbi:MAG: MazG nucleotide pyrophosphohydrolase domain-containing protein [Candidatus Aenigmatarchaeota archaeon]
MEELQKKTAEINTFFEQKIRERKWTPEVIMTDLMEEVGELSNAILVREKFKSEKRKKADLKDSVADVLFDLILIANYYNIDVKREFMKMAEELKERIDSGKMK